MYSSPGSIKVLARTSRISSAPSPPMIISEELMKSGIIVRDCSSFRGLDDYYIRVSVATMEEDERFINVLSNILK